MALTLHGRNSRLYLGVTNAVPLIRANGFPASKWELQIGSDFLEDTSQGDGNKSYVPGLPDFSGSVDTFYQDVTTAGPQFELIDAAIAGTPVKFYAYPGAGAGIVTVYFYGQCYLSLKSLPADVNALVTASFDMKAAGTVTYKHP